MISVNDFKTGLTVEVEGDIYTVLDFQHVKPGKGAAFVRSKLKNLRNGNTVEKHSAQAKRSAALKSTTAAFSTCMQADKSMCSWITKPMTSSA